MNVDVIKWDKDFEKATHKYFSFLIYVLNTLDINFNEFEYDAIYLRERCLNGRCDDEQKNKCLDYYWGYIDIRKATVDFVSKDVLKSRLAISLLHEDFESFDDLYEALYWFLQILEKYGFSGNDLQKLINIYFCR